MYLPRSVFVCSTFSYFSLSTPFSDRQERSNARSFNSCSVPPSQLRQKSGGESTIGAHEKKDLLLCPTKSQFSPFFLILFRLLYSYDPWASCANTLFTCSFSPLPILFLVPPFWPVSTPFDAMATSRKGTFYLLPHLIKILIFNSIGTTVC